MTFFPGRRYPIALPSTPLLGAICALSNNGIAVPNSLLAPVPAWVPVPQ